MRLTKAHVVLLVVMGAGLPALIAASAGADVKVRQVKTEVRFLEVNRMTYLDFSGAIDTKKRCRDERDVNLFYKPDASSPPQQIGTTETTKSGTFVVQLSSPATAGLYGAEIELDIDVVRKGDDKLKFRCRPVAPVFYSF